MPDFPDDFNPPPDGRDLLSLLNPCIPANRQPHEEVLEYAARMQICQRAQIEVFAASPVDDDADPERLPDAAEIEGADEVRRLLEVAVTNPTTEATRAAWDYVQTLNRA